MSPDYARFGRSPTACRTDSGTRPEGKNILVIGTDKTGKQAFMARYALMGAAAIKERGDENTELAGFLDASRAHDWQITHVLSAAAGPSGKIKRKAFDWLCEPILASIKKYPFDGLLLGLHGAMVLDFCDDGEGELLQRIRSLVGKEMPIAITLDPHANVSEKMCELADIIVSFQTYPHIDMRDIGRQAGDILQPFLNHSIPFSIMACLKLLKPFRND